MNDYFNASDKTIFVNVNEDAIKQDDKDILILPQRDLHFDPDELKCLVEFHYGYCPRCGRETICMPNEKSITKEEGEKRYALYAKQMAHKEYSCILCCKRNKSDIFAIKEPSKIHVKVKVTEEIVCSEPTPVAPLTPQVTTKEITVFDGDSTSRIVRIEMFEHSGMWTFDPLNDPNALLGVAGGRWLCRGGAALESSVSGSGKSVARLQRAISYAMGLPAFGVSPVNNRHIKSVVLQVENDYGDEAEIYRGVIRGLSATHGIAEGDIINAIRDLVIIGRIEASGDTFAQVLENILEEHRPDIVWLDPIFPLWGRALSDLGEFTEFTRNRIAPILTANKCAAYLTHHFEKTGKGYFGPSDLLNWVRADVEITRCESDTSIYCFSYKKRGERSGVPDKKHYARHSSKYLFWEDCAPPPDVIAKPDNKRSEAINDPQKKEEDEFQRAMKLVKLNTEFTVKQLLTDIKAEFGCQQRKAENIWALMREQGEKARCRFVQLSPGVYRCESII